MKFLTGLLIIMAAAFYIVWPAYSGYRIKTALEAGDVPALERGVDFPSVRTSMQPVVAEKVEQSLKAASKGTPGGDLVVEAMRENALPKLVDTALDKLVTPQALIRLHAEGKSIKEVVEGVAKDKPDLAGQLGGLLGGLLGKGSSTSSGTGSGSAGNTVVPEARRLGLGNIKSVGFNGPFSVSVGVARDAKAASPDMTATMSFVGGDWKLTGLVPRF